MLPRKLLFLIAMGVACGCTEAPLDSAGVVVVVPADGKSDALGTSRYYLCQSRFYLMAMIGHSTEAQTSYYAPDEVPDPRCAAPSDDVDLVVVYDHIASTVNRQSDESPYPGLFSGDFSVRYSPVYLREEPPPAAQGDSDPPELAMLIHFRESWEFTPFTLEVDGVTVPFFTAMRVVQTPVEGQSPARTLELTYLHPSSGKEQQFTRDLDPDQHFQAGLAVMAISAPGALAPPGGRTFHYAVESVVE